jgi:hypothetical protein
MTSICRFLCDSPICVCSLTHITLKDDTDRQHLVRLGCHKVDKQIYMLTHRRTYIHSHTHTCMHTCMDIWRGILKLQLKIKLSTYVMYTLFGIWDTVY